MGRRKRGEEPQMRFHAHSGQARVRINGQVIYLGPWDSPEAKQHYHRIVAEWHATGEASTATSAAPRARRRIAASPREPAAGGRRTGPHASAHRADHRGGVRTLGRTLRQEVHQARRHEVEQHPRM
jgi:hypothetical protein